MTIQGTGISLNTPDAIAAWIAERKKNWPTAERVAEKVSPVVLPPLIDLPLYSKNVKRMPLNVVNLKAPATSEFGLMGHGGQKVTKEEEAEAALHGVVIEGGAEAQ